MTAPSDGPRPVPPTSPSPSSPSERASRDVEPDVERLHRAIAREPRGPVEGREPVPWWLWAAAVLAIFWAGWYLGRYGGSFGTATHVALGGPDQAVSEAAAEQAAEEVDDPVGAGKQIFVKNCQACHQPTGRGVPGAFPPIVGSEWVVGSPEVVGRIVLDGLEGPIHVAGVGYDGAMPGWRDILSDQQIANVITYTRQWAPNTAGPVSPRLIAEIREVTAARGRPWSAAELSAPLDGGAPSPPRGRDANDTTRPRGLSP